MGKKAQMIIRNEQEMLKNGYFEYPIIMDMMLTSLHMQKCPTSTLYYPWETNGQGKLHATFMITTK